MADLSEAPSDAFDSEEKLTVEVSVSDGPPSSDEKIEATSVFDELDSDERIVEASVSDASNPDEKIEEISVSGVSNSDEEVEGTSISDAFNSDGSMVVGISCGM